MSDVNRSINIYINEADVEASLARMQKTAAKLEQQMKDIGDKSSPEFTKLSTELSKVHGNMNTLTKQLSGEINPTIKQMEAAVSKLKNELRNTSTGTEEFIAKSKKLGEVEKNLNKVKQEAFGVSKAIESTGKSGGVLDFLKDKIMGFAGSIPGIGTAITAVMGPLGLIVGAFSLLIGLLSQNAEVADKFSSAMGALKKIIQTLADDLVSLIKTGFGGLQKALENPKQALLDFGKAIVQNVINHFTALGVIIDAVVTGDFKKLGNGVIQLVTGFENGADAMQKFGKHIAEAGESGWKSAEALDALANAQAKLQANIERTNIEIAKQETLMKDTTRTDEERLAAAKRVIALETANSNRRIQQINLEIAAYNEKYKGIVLTGEQEAELTMLNVKLDQERFAKENAIRKATLEANKLAAELAAKQLKESMTVDAIPAITKAVLDSQTEVANMTKVNTNTYIQGIETFASYAEMRVKGMLDNLKGYWSEWGQVFQAGIQSINTLVSDGLDLQRAKSDKELAHDKKANDTKIKQLKYQLDTKRISQTQYDKAVEKMMEQQAAKEKTAKLKQFKADKAAKIAMTIINTAMAVVNALATMPYPASIAMAAIAGATGAAQIGIIAAQPVPEFSRGGLLRGRSHAQGGMAVVNENGRKVAELEGDEFIVNKRATARHMSLLRMINGDSGPSWNGNFPKFNSGGVFRAAQYANGGLFTAQGAHVDSMQLALLENILVAVQQPQRNYVVYEDVKTRGNDLARAQARSSFSQS